MAAGVREVAAAAAADGTVVAAAAAVETVVEAAVEGTMAAATGAVLGLPTLGAPRLELTAGEGEVWRTCGRKE